MPPVGISAVVAGKIIDAVTTIELMHIRGVTYLHAVNTVYAEQWRTASGKECQQLSLIIDTG